MQQKLPWFLEAKASEACAKGGAGAYTDLIQTNASDPTGIAGLTDGRVSASAFRTAYVPLSSQSDFIKSMKVMLLTDLPSHRPRLPPVNWLVTISLLAAESCRCVATAAKLLWRPSRQVILGTTL